MLLIVVCAVAATLIVVMSQTNLFTPETEIKDGLAPLALPDFVEDSGILFPFIESATIIAGEKAVAIPLYNPESNNCFLTFEIILADTGESLYMSGLVAPSERIEGQELARGLPEGRYKANLVIRAYDLGNYEEIWAKTGPIELIAGKS